MRPVNVYAELTPNPNSLKFVADVMLLEGGTVEYQNPQQAVNCPLAKELFSFSGIERVFISSNFVTINKNSDLDWFEITNILREFIRGFLMSDEKLFLNSPFSEDHIPSSTHTTASPSAPETKSSDTTRKEVGASIAADPDAEKKIIALLDEYIRPAVESDGGAIDFRSFTDGTVRVVLRGACSGCPSSTVTLKSGIENLLKQMVPGVKEVIAIQD